MKKKLQLLMILLLAAPIGLLAQGTSQSAATEIKNGNTATGSMSNSTVAHWYKVVIAEDGVATFTVKAGSGLGFGYTTMYAVDAAGELKSRGNLWSDGDLVVKSCAKGTYYVEVKRNNGQGTYTIAYNFAPTSAKYANDTEPNDTYQQAQALGKNTTTTGHLGYSYWDDTDAVDWYKIDVPENGKVTITMTAHGDLGLGYTTLYALGADGNINRRGDVWSGNEETPGVLTMKNCAKGTYYVQVKQNGAQGGYTIAYDFAPMSASYANDSEPNDTYQQAKPLDINKTVTGHLGYGYWDDTDAVDWYRVNVPENGALIITMKAHGDLGLGYTTVYALSTADGDVHRRGDVWSGSDETPAVLTVSNCAKGTYYVQVKHNGGQGGYTLDCQFIPMSATYANDVEPNNSWDTGKYLKRGSTITGHLGYGYWDDTDGVDWHYLTVPRDGTITLNIEAHDPLGIGYTTIYAKDANGELQSRRDVWSNGTITVPNAAPGNYYVRVNHNGGQGAYSLQYKFDQNPYATDAEPNNDMASAVTLTKGATVAGHLGYGYWDDTDGVDWYKFTLTTTADVTFTYQIQEGLSLGYVTLYNDKGNNLKDVWSVDENRNNTLTKTELAAGTYYLKVNHNGGQGYYLLTYGSTLGTVAKQDPLPDETDGETIKIGDALVAGFSSNYNLDFTPLQSKGVSAWIATGFNDGNVMLSRVFVVPAGEGVYVKAEKAGTYEIPFTSKEPFYVNMFVGVPDGATVDKFEDYYGETYLTLSFALSKTTGKPSFFPNTGPKTYGKNKMYLHMPARLLPEYAESRLDEFSLGIIFEEDEAMGISDASLLNDNGQMMNQNPGAVFNLNGQRLATPQKGLNIINRRKIVIK